MGTEAGGLLGTLLRHWRSMRGMSQMDLGLAAQVSTRHLSFVENGRARPSRELLLVVASVLDIPLRERNALLHAAGFAPAYRETGLAEPAMRSMRHAIELLLRAHEPFGAVVLDRCWDIVMVNQGYARFLSLLGADQGLGRPYALCPAPRRNALSDLLTNPNLRAHVANWEHVARYSLLRARSELAWDVDPARRERFENLTAAPEIEALLRSEKPLPEGPVLPLELTLGGASLRLFSTLSTVGTALDITLQELRIEAFHPADEATEALARAALSG